MTLLRTVLYTPGHRADLIAKAPRFGADALCLVLEDSVPEAHKDEARAITRDSIGALAAQGQTVLVKVNPVERDAAASGDADDELRTVVVPGLTGIVVPKLACVADVRHVDERLSLAEAHNGCPAGSVKLLLLVETPRAAHEAFDIASASPRVMSVIAGTAANGDMARELGFHWTPEGLERLYLRSKVLMDARAAGVESPLDGVYADVDDRDGLVREAEVARQLGYRGKLVVHPAHVEPVNRVFTPSAREVETQQRVLEAFEAALADGSAAAVVDGRFVDYAMAATARDIIDLARRAGVPVD